MLNFAKHFLVSMDFFFALRSTKVVYDVARYSNIQSACILGINPLWMAHIF